jgi:hypothetical protein
VVFENDSFRFKCLLWVSGTVAKSISLIEDKPLAVAIRSCHEALSRNLGEEDGELSGRDRSSHFNNEGPKGILHGCLPCRGKAT